MNNIVIKYLDLMPTREHKPRSIGKESEIKRFFLIWLFKIIMKASWTGQV